MAIITNAITQPTPTNQSQVQTMATPAQQTSTPIGNTDSQGLITSAQGYTPSQLNNPTSWNVDNSQTVAGQLNTLQSDNSPLMQMAKSQAAQDANARGLLNSSMAVTAGQAAAYQAALPIAQADAATYAKAAGYNADMNNQFAVKNVDTTNAATQFNADAINKTAAQNSSVIGQTNITKLQTQNSMNIAQLQAQYGQLTQTNATAASLFSNYQAQTAAIDQANMTVEAKAAAKNNQMQILQDGLNTLATISSIPGLENYYHPATYT